MNISMRSLLMVAALATGTAAHAGLVLVPVPEPLLPGGATRSVRLTFSNLGEVTRRGTPVYVPAGADGTGPARVPLPAVAIGPRATEVVDYAGLAGGLLELTLAPQLVVRAELLLRDLDGTVVATAELGIVDADAVGSAAESVLMLGLARGNGQLSDVVLVNASDEVPAVCAVELRSNVGVAVGYFQYTLALRTSLTLTDILAGFSGAEVQALVTCTADWAIQVVVTDLAGYRHRVSGVPALGSSALTVPAPAQLHFGGEATAVTAAVTAAGSEIRTH